MTSDPVPGRHGANPNSSRRFREEASAFFLEASDPL
jgi:hypothetical protein